MQAEFHHSATPFKFLPKQSASNSDRSHAPGGLPRQGRGHKRKYVHKRGRHQFTARSHDTRSLGPSHVPPQKAAASTNQQNNEAAETTSLQAIQGSTATLPPTGACIPLLAAVQASLLPASRALNTARPSRAHKTSLTPMPFIFSANGVAALNHVQIIHNTTPKVSFHCHNKKKCFEKSTQIPIRPSHCALPRTGSLLLARRSPLIPFLPARTYNTVAIPPKKDFATCWHSPHFLSASRSPAHRRANREIACMCVWMAM
ncbi:hypothetical protein TcCL_NonESM02056 [Trypanosoma cruzi]|nr:hypothetical protein TcCL_NonESM02056 [Trypanosoma cruzi]